MSFNKMNNRSRKWHFRSWKMNEIEQKIEIVLDKVENATVTHYDAGKSNVRTYLLRDYTQELAAAHGVRANYSDFSLDRIQKIAQNNISASFLALT